MTVLDKVVTTLILPTAINVLKREGS